MFMACRTLFQLPITIAIALTGRQHQNGRKWETTTGSIPSVPSESVESFCSSASIWDAIAALRSRNSFRCSNSALFSFTRTTRAGGGPVEAFPPIEGCRICVDSDRVGNDILVSARC